MFYESVFFWGISVVRRFHSTPLTLEKLFFKWIRNKIISFSYCKVKVLNEYLTLLVKQYSLKSSNKLVKKVSLYSVHWQCNKNNHIPLENQTKHFFKIIENPPKKSWLKGLGKSTNTCGWNSIYIIKQDIIYMLWCIADQAAGLIGLDFFCGHS